MAILYPINDICQRKQYQHAGFFRIRRLEYTQNTTYQVHDGANMTIAERIRFLRQERKWTQAELAERLGIHQKQVSAYERGVNLPSTDILIKLAEVFDVTLDYLAFEAKGGTGKLNIQDRELLRRFEVVDTLSEQEKTLAKEILDLVILKHRFQELAGTRMS
jgi:transcriptional regulator with XRE-family HTH domain